MKFKKIFEKFKSLIKLVEMFHLENFKRKKSIIVLQKKREKKNLLNL